MKIRNGFISNSSSSNFIVAFPTTPGTPTELKDILFNKIKEWKYDGGFSKTKYPTETIAKQIFPLMKKKASSQKVFEAISSGYYEGHPNFPSFEKVKEDEWLKFDKEWEKRARKIAVDFMKKHTGKDIYIFTFADDTEIGALLEQSNVFFKLPHMEINCH